MIVPMKKATLAVMYDTAPAVIKALQRIGEFMIIPGKDGSLIRLKSNEKPLSEEARTALKAYEKFRRKKGLLSAPYECTYEEFNKENDTEKQNVITAIRLAEELDSQNAQIKRLQEEKAGLSVFSGLSLTAEELGGSGNTRILVGKLPLNEKKGETNPLTVLSDIYSFAFEIYRTEKNALFFYAVCFYEDIGNIRAELLKYGLEELSPPYKSGTADENIRKIEAKIATLRFEAEQTEEKLREEAKNASAVELFADKEKAKAQRGEIYAEKTESSVVIQGWVRSDHCGKVENAVKSATDDYWLVFRDPQEDETPPTVTKNNKFVTQFETITDTFSLPSQGDIDPNPIMAPWYFILFGIMMGDVGYGLIMLLGCFLFKRIKKPRGEMLKLVNCIQLGGITTVIWGVIFGSYFGAAWLPPLWFNPADTNDSTAVVKMLIFSLIIGVLHLFTGVIAKAYMNIKQKKWLDAVLDQLPAITLILGIGMIFLDATRQAGIITAIVSAAVVLITGGRKNKNPVMKIFGGFIALYNIATGYLSDILSYSRLLALCLCTGIIGMVMNILGGMIAGISAGGVPIGIIIAIPIYILGHTLNLVLAILSAYVHDSRLQFIELYSKFYEGGGKPFTPLKIETDYTVVSDKEPVQSKSHL